MQKKSFSEIQNFLNRRQSDIEQLSKLNILILRNITIEPIAPYLRFLAFQNGFNAYIRFGEYDNVIQETVGGSDISLDSADVILIFIRLDTLSWDLTRNFPGLNLTEIQSEVERVKDYIETVLFGIRKQTKSMILWHSFENPIYPALGIRDNQSPHGQSTTIKVLNHFLQQSLQNANNAYFVDLNQIISRIGAVQFFDVRYWHIARSPYTRQALAEIGAEDYKYIRALKGKNKKCLVLDCDNTLWGGVIGEDGITGIKLGKTYPGSIYQEFQQEILGLYNRGVILALCSKNNEADVWEVFEKHPDMILRKEHIATAQINWQDKATNLRQISIDLNIGLDSLVFVDDSEFEASLIRQALPEVEVIHLPIQNAVTSREQLASYGWFDTLVSTEEDKHRGLMYKAEVSRKRVRSQFVDLESYLISLEMVAEIRFADQFSIPRIAQLTRKTNQFNLTTRRYSEADIQELVGRNDVDVLYIRLSDRFSDLGIVGVCIIKYQRNQATLDTFLLSCRALGRRAEDVLLGHCLYLAQIRGCEVVYGIYIPTKKNSQTKNFLPNRGFSSSYKDDEKRKFIYHLNEFTLNDIDCFKRIKSEILNLLEVT